MNHLRKSGEWSRDIGATASDMNDSLDWDILTTLSWIATRDVLVMAECRLVWLRNFSDLLGDTSTDLENWFETYVSPNNDLRDQKGSPAFQLKQALKWGRILAWGYLPGGLRRESIDRREWPHRQFCGGILGELVGGARVAGGANDDTRNSNILAISFNRTEVTTFFPPSSHVTGSKTVANEKSAEKSLRAVMDRFRDGSADMPVGVIWKSEAQKNFNISARGAERVWQSVAKDNPDMSLNAGKPRRRIRRV